MNLNKINKYIEFATTKIKILYKEKRFKSHGYELKYILEPNNKSRDLVIIFSGIPRPGIKARYNYNRTLQRVKANKLFILDDFGYDHRGAYYLGKDKDFLIQAAVKDLIAQTESKLTTTSTIYVGSSKGGYAAILFGIQKKYAKIVAGSLQYRLGNYLTSHERRRTNIMAYVMGEHFTDADTEFLNEYLGEIIRNNSENENIIHLHFSDSEYTYEDHMKHLLKDLDDSKVAYTAEVLHYKEHKDLAVYFPPFLVKTILDLLS